MLDFFSSRNLSWL